MLRIRCFIFLQFYHISKVGFRACTTNNQINHWLFICMMFCCITCYTSKKLGCCESLDVLISVEISGQYDSSLQIGHSTFATPPSGRLLSATASRTNLQSSMAQYQCQHLHFHQVLLPNRIKFLAHKNMINMEDHNGVNSN